MTILSRLLAGAAALALMASCTQYGLRSSRPDPRNQYLGKPLDSLIRVAGPPAREYQLSDGGRVVENDDSYDAAAIVGTRRSAGPSTYQSQGTMTTRPDGLGNLRTDYQSTTTQRPGVSYLQGLETQQVRNACFTTFVTDAQLRIVRWSERGSGC